MLAIFMTLFYQGNQSMKTFQNKGWIYGARMDQLLPAAGATGEHSFVPTQAAPPPSVDDEDIPEDVIDEIVDEIQAPQSSSGKRKHSTITTPDDEPIPLSPSSRPSTPPIVSAEPPLKKIFLE